jgi:hypothetical protein
MDKIKFIDDMHDDTEDSFKIEKDYKGRLYIRVYQERYSGITSVYLSEGDIRQIYAKLEDLNNA